VGVTAKKTTTKKTPKADGTATPKPKGRKAKGERSAAEAAAPVVAAPSAGRPSSLLDTRVIYCGDNLEQLAKLPDACIDLVYIDPPFNSNRNYEVFWGETPPAKRSDRSRIGTRTHRRTSTTCGCAAPAPP